MHPLLNIQLAQQVQKERRRQAGERRHATHRRAERSPAPQPRAPWPAGWSAHHPSLRSD
jgi:hypothetical protein